MSKWFSNENKRMLKEHGIDDDFPWGAIEQIHPIGDFHIVEYINNDDVPMFHPYVNRIVLII